MTKTIKDKCWRKEVSERELDRLVKGDKLTPSTPGRCYDCRGYNDNCKFYETIEQKNLKIYKKRINLKW